MTNKKTNKSSAKRKLVPAIGMLTVSAMMLSSATYAWFTMSREVEVKNIQMTASVPEDIQISLGKLTNIKTTGTGNPTAAEIAVKSNNYVGLSGNQGILDKGDAVGASADNGGVLPPANNSSDDDAEALYWSNTADISEYYRLGKIIPASSTKGEDIFFTPDATGVGKTLKTGAKFYQVASINSATFAPATIFGWDDTAGKYIANGTGDKARTTLHAITNADESQDTWNPAAGEGAGNGYTSASAWNVTNDDGYYVDIPMWIRSSSKTATALSVDAFVTTNAGKTDDGSAANDDELYMAARAAIIYANDVTDADKAVTVNTSSNLLSIRKDTFATETSIIDYMYSTNSQGDAVASVEGTTATYGAVTEYTGDDIIAIPGRDASDATKKYGNMVKVVVRVWLEGEDPNCWNPNAGQDFNISLKFVKGEIKEGTEENASGYKYPTAWAMGTKNAASGLDVDASTVVTITETTINGSDGTLKFTYDGNKWNQTTGSVEILDGKTYQLKKDGTVVTTVTGADDIAAWLKDNVTKKDAAAAVYTITVPTPDPGTP